MYAWGHVCMSQQVGLRIEHPQELMNRIQVGYLL
jgi:uncharacterized FAD-dependent dehydrogenase